MKLLLAFVIILLLLMMCSCGAPKVPSPPPTASDNWEYHGVKEIHLSDGTRCAVYSSYKKGGIDCEWKTPIER